MIANIAQGRREKGWAIKEPFRIQHHRNSESLHLRLTGVFDGEAALSLMEVLNENRARVGKIFVHTACIERVLDSGAEVFRSYLSSWKQSGAEIIFSGKKGEEIAVKATGLRFIM